MSTAGSIRQCRNAPVRASVERLAIEIFSGRRRDEFEIDKDAMNTGP
jgi:hypothetical protein